MESILSAGAVITDEAGRVLLVQRGKEPQKGLWSLPGGRCEPGESLAQTVAREVWEETGLRVHVGPELWSLMIPITDGQAYEVHDFAAAVISGTLIAGDDAADARWVAPSGLGELPLTVGLLDYLGRAGVILRPRPQ